jgi:O-antigen/teichoic acid export membrane protein
LFKKIFKDSVLLTVANQLPSLVSLFTLPILTPHLTPLDYGIWSLVFAYIGGFSAFRDLGLITVYTNIFFKYNRKYQHFWNKLFAFNLIWSLVYSFILGCILYFLIHNRTKENTLLVVFLSVLPVCFFENTKVLGMRILQFHQIFSPIVVSSLVTTLVQASLNIYFIKYCEMGYKGWFIASCAANACNFIFFFKVLHIDYKIYPDFRFSFAWLKRKLKVSLPTIPHFYSTYVLNASDRLVLDMYKYPTGLIGIYGVAYNFGTYLDSMQIAIGQVLSPIYYKWFSNKEVDADRNVRMITFLWQGGSIILASLLSLWLKEIFAFLYRREEFSTAYMYGIPILMSYTYRPFYMAIANRLIFKELTKTVLLISTVAAAINLVLNIILVPFMGIYAAIFTTFLALMYMAFSGYYIPKTRKHVTLNYYPFFWLCLITVSTFVVYGLKDFAVLYKVIITLLFAGFLYGGFRKYANTIRQMI